MTTAKRDPHLVRSLTSLLEHQCRLHERYLQLLERERQAVTRAEAGKLQAMNQERAELLDAVSHGRNRLAEFMGRYPQGREMRLSVWLEHHAHPADRLALEPLIKRLKSSTTASKQKSSELTTLVGFALNMVGGCLSILWSATQNVVRGYNQTGRATESYNPPRTRADGTLKEA